MFSEETLERIAREKVRNRIILQIHAVVYGITNLFLILINYLTIRDYLWFAYPALGWLIGLGLHAVYYLSYARGVARGKMLFYLHLIAFVLVNGLLVFINWYNDTSYWWAIWPLSCWSPGLGLHLLFTIRNPLSREKGSYFDRALEKEMAKIRDQQGHTLDHE